MSFIPVEYYRLIYFILLVMFTFFTIFPLFNYKAHQQIQGSKLRFFSILILIIVISFIGLRDPFGAFIYLGDTITYSNIYEYYKSGEGYNNLKDSGFYMFMSLCSNYLTISQFYMLCSLLYVILPYLAFKKWFKQNAFFALLLFAVSMSFWAYGVNGVRNGLATSILIYSFSLNHRKLLMALLMLVAISFHNSVLLPVLAYIITFKFTNSKLLIRVWIFMVVFSFFYGNSINQFVQDINSFINFDSSERTRDLFASELDGREISRGYRLDFIIYSGVGIILGHTYIYIKGLKDMFYIRLFNTFIICNTIWLILIYAAYSNRIAYLSWFIMPVVMIYPLLKYKMLKNQSRVIAYLIFGSLFMTLLVYYK